MAIKIDKDAYSAGDKFKVSTHEPGFGRGISKRGLSLDAALELARHYYMVPEHIKADCAWCAESSKPQRRRAQS